MPAAGVLDKPFSASQVRQAIDVGAFEAAVPMNAVGSAGIVQRTRRVIRQQATDNQQRRRSLWTLSAAVLLSCALMAVLMVPVWNELDDLAHWSGIPDLQMHMLFLGMWFLPGTAISLLLWRGRRRNSDSEPV